MEIGLRFADGLLDNFLLDWVVQSRISRAREMVHETAQRIDAVLARLSPLVDRAEAATRAAMEERRALLSQGG